MSIVSEGFIEKLKNSVDIINIVSDYVALKKTGKNYKGLCPFHQEKTPSFTINPDKQFYYCFGCGAGGNVFNFLMEIENITFRETLKILARRAGLQIPEQTEYERKVMMERDHLFEINQLAAKFYHYLLTENDIAQNAREYLEDRGFGREDWDKFHLGYAPPGWRSLLNFMLNRDYHQQDLLKAGLVLNNKNNNFYDRFRDRIIFPIFNQRGEVLAFGGRIFNSANQNGPKYLNSPDTSIYKKGENIYGFNWAREKIRETGIAIIMEGYTDVLRAQQTEIINAVASLGTALTIEQARLLKRYADTVLIAYDADTAGASATLRGLEILKSTGLNVRVIDLPEDTDPDEFIRDQGREEFLKLQDDAITLVDFKIKRIYVNQDLEQTDNKIKVTHQIIQLLADLEDQVEREMYLQSVAERFQLSLPMLQDEVEKVIETRKKKNQDKNYQNRYTKKDNKTNYRNNINRLERIILQVCLENSNLGNQLRPEYFSAENKKTAEIVLTNQDNIQAEIDNLDNDKLRKDLLALSVADIPGFSETQLNLLIDKLLFNNKLNIYRELQNKDGLSLSILNNLLIDFQQLSDNQRKEGF